MAQLTYYLWRTPDGIFYITDYKEQKNGLTKINSSWYDVELKFQSTVKTDLIAAAEKIVFDDQKNKKL